MSSELHAPLCETCLSPYRAKGHAGAGRGISLALPGAVNLVEVLIASSLLAAVCTTLPVAFASALRTSVAAGETTVAVVLAAQKIEELRSFSFPASGAFESSELLDAAGHVVTGPQPSPAFRRMWRTEPLGAAAGETVVIAVAVGPIRHSASMRLDAATAGVTRLVTLRTRTAT